MKEDDRISNLEEKIAKIEEMLECIIKQYVKTSDITDSDPCVEGKTRLTDVEREKIGSIMEDFNFQKVHDVMEMLGWKWIGAKDGVPSVDEIRAEAKRILVDAVREKTTIATGGFRAVYEDGTPDDPDTYIALEFIVEECEGLTEV